MSAGRSSLPVAPVHTGRRRPAIELTAWLLVSPAVLTILVLFVVPIGYVLLLSVTDPTVSLAHYQRLFTVPLYTSVLINTFKTSLIVTIACLLLGYPLAYVMSRRNDAVALIFLVAVGMSFWTGFVVRTYAWLVILGNKGPVSALYDCRRLGPAAATPVHDRSARRSGMVHILLPYMVLALYGVMRKIDPNLHARGRRPRRAAVRRLPPRLPAAQPARAW